ncbi:MAG: hypothetical protein FWF96_04305 [Kiritimatiellaeota bacterium]|nr:hypothetical protein [Kiritimatiellota bacterium]
MKKTICLLAACVSATTAVAHEIPVCTPLDMALALERETARFVGVFMPDTNRPFGMWSGVLPFLEGETPVEPQKFPQEFLAGLVCTQEFGIATWPVRLRVNDETGVTYFYNAAGVSFWEEEPRETYHTEWVVDLYGREVSLWVRELLRPSHVEARWVFVEEENIQAYHVARWESFGRQGGRGTAQWGALNVPELYTTAFSPVEDSWHFFAEWNRVAYFPLSRLDVRFAPDLRASHWPVVWSVPVTRRGLEGGAFVEIPKAAISEDHQTLPGFEHEEFCEPLTNVVYSSLVEGVAYTNVVCECARPKSPTGFFKLTIPDPSQNIPAWWRVLYGFAPWDSWEDGFDFTGDGWVNWEKHDHGVNPVAPPGGGNAAGIHYFYDDDDRLLSAFPGADGDASYRQLSPAGNVEIQQERTAP